MRKILLTLAVSAAASTYCGVIAARGQSLSRSPRAEDRSLAERIRRMSDLSTVGMKQKRAPLGGVGVDLEGRFCDLVIGKLDNDGDPAVACVSNVQGAGRFLGRDLETGEVYPVTPTDTEEYLRTKRAAPEMTFDEFLFYKDLIRKASPGFAGGSFALDSSTSSTVINIINNDGPNEGFNDPAPTTFEDGNNNTTLGAQRLALFKFAANIWAGVLDSTVPINIGASFDSMTPCSSSGGVLGAAGSAAWFRDFPGAEFTSTWYPKALANKIVGVDQDSAKPDIEAVFNSDVDTGCLGQGTRFYYGFSPGTPTNRINLLTVILHEMGHGFGFETLTDGTTGAQFSGNTDIFARHIFDRSKNKYWNQMTDAERKTSAVNNGNIFWDGANVQIASLKMVDFGPFRDPAGRVQLYAPSTYSDGSSVSHWDTSITPDLLMEPIITGNQGIDLDITREQMRDIGWFRDMNGDRVPDTISNVTVSPASPQVFSNAQVTWTNGGFNGNIILEYSTDGGATYTQMDNLENVTKTSATFAVPDKLTTQARVRVREWNYVSPGGVSPIFSTTPSTQPTQVIAFPYTAEVNEGDGFVDMPVVRVGDLSGTASVDYSTIDGFAGDASQASDYEFTSGTLTFNPGESRKTFRIYIVDDSIIEYPWEDIRMTLSNPQGIRVALGNPSTGDVRVYDNDTDKNATNPFDDARFFVRQNYLDFLNRAPDTSGWNFWTNEITQCGADAACKEVKRINASAAFFLSIEFQSTGYEAYLTHRCAFGPTTPTSPVPVLYTRFMRDVQKLGNGYIFGASGAEQVLEANKVAYFDEFVTRPEFINTYPASITNQQYVDAILTTASLQTTGSFRDSLLTDLDSGAKTRATVLRSIAESSTIKSREFNNAFVAMQYFGYLRRDPDSSGYNFWLTKLNSFNGDYIAAEMVKAFITSTETRQRFGTP